MVSLRRTSARRSSTHTPMPPSSAFSAGESPPIPSRSPRTNFIDIGYETDPRTNRVILMSAEDNLGKGAGGQAVQSFNIMHGLDQTTGLDTW